MKRIKKVLTWIIGIFISLIILFNIYNFINIRILKNDLTKIGGYSILEVISGSMEPTIKIGDLIIIDTSVKEFNKNDIVTFYDVNGSFVTHRIMSINNNMMITKGDNNNTEDESINMNNIVGRYVFKIPFAGMLLSSFKSPVFLSIVLIIGVLFCYILSTDDNGKLVEEEKKESIKKTNKVEKELKNKKDDKKKTTTKKEVAKKDTSTKGKTKKAATKKVVKKDSSKTTSKKVEEKKTTPKKEVKKTSTKKDSSKTTTAKKNEVKKTTTKKVSSKTPTKKEVKKTTAKTNKK